MLNPNVAPVPWLYNQLWLAQDQGGFAYQVQVYKAVTCPCGNTPTSPSNINCQACAGYGVLYPSPSIEVYALISGIDQNLDLVEQGLMEYGDMVMSPQPGTLHMDDYDMAILPWSIGIPTFSEVIVRGSGTTDTAQYRMEHVETAYTVVPQTGVVTAYVPGTDFVVSGKTITWSADAPSEGTLYSLRYGAQFEWVAFNPPTPRVAFGQDLGQRAILRKRHILLPNAPSLLEG